MISRKSILFFSFLFIACCLLTQSSQAQWMSITKSTPARGQKNVPLNQIITLHFSESVPSLTTPDNILIEMPSKSSVPVNVSFSENGKTMYLQPKSPLKRGTYYVISLDGIESRASNPVNAYQNNIDFTTEGGQFFCVAYASPSEIYLAPGGFRDIVYTFIEQGGGWGEIMRCKVVYENSSGQELLRNTEELKLIIPDKQTLKFPSSVLMPKDLGSNIMGQTITIRRIFEGLDHDNNQISIRTGVKVKVGNPPSSIPDSFSERSASDRLYISTPVYGSVIPRNSMIPLEGIIQGRPGTQIHGCWLFNGTPMGFFASSVPSSGVLKQIVTDKMFAASDGRHNIALQIISPEKAISEKIEYIVASQPINTPVLMTPKPGELFKTGDIPVLRWSEVPGAVSYKISLSTDRNMKGSVWIDSGRNVYTPSQSWLANFTTRTIYWSVKPVFPGNKEGQAVPPFQFTLR